MMKKSLTLLLIMILLLLPLTSCSVAEEEDTTPPEGGVTEDQTEDDFDFSDAYYGTLLFEDYTYWLNWNYKESDETTIGLTYDRIVEYCYIRMLHRGETLEVVEDHMRYAVIPEELLKEYLETYVKIEDFAPKAEDFTKVLFDENTRTYYVLEETLSNKNSQITYWSDYLEVASLQETENNIVEAVIYNLTYDSQKLRQSKNTFTFDCTNPLFPILIDGKREWLQDSYIVSGTYNNKGYEGWTEEFVLDGVADTTFSYREGYPNIIYGLIDMTTGFPKEVGTLTMEVGDRFKEFKITDTEILMFTEERIYRYDFEMNETAVIDLPADLLDTPDDEAFMMDYTVSDDLSKIAYITENGVFIDELGAETPSPSLLATHPNYEKGGDELSFNIYKDPTFVSNENTLVLQRVGYEMSVGILTIDLTNYKQKELTGEQITTSPDGGITYLNDDYYTAVQYDVSYEDIESIYLIDILTGTPSEVTLDGIESFLGSEDALYLEIKKETMEGFEYSFRRVSLIDGTSSIYDFYVTIKDDSLFDVEMKGVSSEGTLIIDITHPSKNQSVFVSLP